MSEKDWGRGEGGNNHTLGDKKSYVTHLINMSFVLICKPSK